MNFHILTLFPEMVENGLKTSIIGERSPGDCFRSRLSIYGILHLTSIKV